MEANDPITIRLTAAEWNQVMAMLGEGPFRIVAPLLGKIREQATAQDGRPAGGVPLGANGGGGADLPAPDGAMGGNEQHVPHR